MESTTGTVIPLPVATMTTPSEFVILYPDITLVYYDLYIGVKKKGKVIDDYQ